MNLHLIPTTHLLQYLAQINPDLQSRFDQLEDAEISTDTFSFYTSVASVYSSKIEGEDIELDSYVKHKRFGVGFLPDYTGRVNNGTRMTYPILSVRYFTTFAPNSQSWQ